MFERNIINSLIEAQECLSEHLKDPEFISSVNNAVELLVNCFKKKGKVILFGNGGSCSDATHFAEELTGRFKKDRSPLPALSLNDGAYITCVANDYGFDQIFVRGVEAFVKKEDLVIGISTSGNSSNVISALEKAIDMQATVLALIGKDGGKIKEKFDNFIHIHHNSTERIQEMHIKILHIFIDELEKKLF